METVRLRVDIRRQDLLLNLPIRNGNTLDAAAQNFGAETLESSYKEWKPSSSTPKNAAW